MVVHNKRFAHQWGLVGASRPGSAEGEETGEEQQWEGSSRVEGLHESWCWSCPEWLPAALSRAVPQHLRHQLRQQRQRREQTLCDQTLCDVTAAVLRQDSWSPITDKQASTPGKPCVNYPTNTYVFSWVPLQSAHFLEALTWMLRIFSMTSVVVSIALWWIGS